MEERDGALGTTPRRGVDELEGIAPQPERVIDRADDQRDMVDAPDRPDGRRELGMSRIRRHLPERTLWPCSGSSLPAQSSYESHSHRHWAGCAPAAISQRPAE